MITAMEIKLCTSVSRVRSDKSTDNPLPEVGVGEKVAVGILGSTIELFGRSADRFTGPAWCTLPGWDRGRGDILCAGDLAVGEYQHKPAD